MSELPRLLLLTDDVIGPSHGTGVVLMRQLAEYPKENILHGYLNQVAEPDWPAPERTLNLCPDVPPHDASADAAIPAVLSSRLDGTGFAPTAVYAHFYGVRGLRALHAILDELERKGRQVKVLQHFQDLRPEGDGQLEELIRRLDARGATIWGLNNAIARELSRILDKHVPTVSTFRLHVPAVHKTEHTAFSKDFRALMLGNVWLPELVQDVRQLWTALAATTPGLAPVTWHGHPFSPEYVAKAGYEPAPQIRYQGFIPRAAMAETLASFDLALVCFNREHGPAEGYARFSLPSRMTHMAAAGLPVLALCGRGTETWDFVETHGIGLAANPADADFATRVRAFLTDRELRAASGAKARKLAEERFGLADYVADLETALTALGQGRAVPTPR